MWPFHVVPPHGLSSTVTDLLTWWFKAPKSSKAEAAKPYSMAKVLSNSLWEETKQGHDIGRDGLFGATFGAQLAWSGWLVLTWYF